MLATSQAVGLLAVLVAAPLVGSGWPDGTDVMISAAGGVSGVIGLLCLYRALALGPMSTAAPLSAVTAAVIPVMIGLALGERPGASAAVGIPLALVAIVVFSRAEGASGEDHHDHANRPPAPPATVALAIASGLGFGLFFVTLDKVSSDTGLWPVVVVRLTSLALVLAVCAISRTSLRLEARVRRYAIPAGVGDVAGNVFVLLANRFGLLSIVSVLASLYPVATVALAQMVLGERFTRAHAAGAGAALIAVVLVALA